MSDTRTTHTWVCSHCEGQWEMADKPLACPHCGNDVIAGWKELREVGVKPDETEDLPRFEELVE